MLAVVDQKPTTGTSAICVCVGGAVANALAVDCDLGIADAAVGVDPALELASALARGVAVGGWLGAVGVVLAKATRTAATTSPPIDRLTTRHACTGAG
jgi:hypothetical protein